MGDRGASEKWTEKTDQSDNCGFLPFRAEDGRIELCSGKEPQDDGARSRKKCNPLVPCPRLALPSSVNESSRLRIARRQPAVIVPRLTSMEGVF
jgi:hypothetical protein